MKQKVVTRAIVRNKDRVLLLRRRGGRPSIDGLYELPGGRIHKGQQPEDALSHGLRIHAGVELGSRHLIDVMTFVDPDDREVQYIFVIFQTSLDPLDDNIILSEEYDKYIWKKLSEIQLNEITHSTQQILGLQPVPFAPGRDPDLIIDNDDKKTTYRKIIGYSDGGSRGNPGPSAAGYVLINTTEEMIIEGGSYLGETTSNLAEYQALYLALERAMQLGAKVVDMRLDSLLVVNQMNGVYKVNNVDILAVHNRVRELLGRFDKVTFTHVSREYNSMADGVVNKILDKHSKVV